MFDSVAPEHVFVTTTDAPRYTYVDRRAQTHGWTKKLDHYLANPANALMVIGPTKLGKTLEIARAIGDNTVIVTATSGLDTRGFFDQLRSRLGMADSRSSQHHREWGHTKKDERDVGGGLKAMGFGFEAKKHAGSARQRRRSLSSGEHFSLTDDQILEEVIQMGCGVVVDDCHLMTPENQRAVIGSLKRLAENGAVALVLVSALEEAFTNVVSHTNLDGRIERCEVPLWRTEELCGIADRGFRALGVNIGAGVVLALARESQGAPFLMQQLCLRLCGEKGIDSDTEIRAVEEGFFVAAVRDIYEPVYGGAVVMACSQAAKRRTLPTGQKESIYLILLYAIGACLPRKTVSIEDELRPRVYRLVSAKEARGLAGLHLTKCCERLVENLGMLPNGVGILHVDRPMGVLSILSPFFACYLRWIVNQRRVALQISMPADDEPWPDPNSGAWRIGLPPGARS